MHALLQFYYNKLYITIEKVAKGSQKGFSVNHFSY